MSVYHSELLLNIIKRNLYMNYHDYDLLWFIGDIHTYSYKKPNIDIAKYNIVS